MITSHAGRSLLGGFAQSIGLFLSGFSVGWATSGTGRVDRCPPIENRTFWYPDRRLTKTDRGFRVQQRY